MKITVPLIATAAILVLALAGCSGAGGPSTSGSATSAPKENGSSSSKTYSADDLVAILKKAEATLGVSGTIKDNATISAEVKKLGKVGTSIADELAKSGGTITPASCVTALNKASDLKAFLSEGGAEASLSYSKGLVGVLTNTNGALPTSITGKMATDLDGLYSTCGHMKITAGSVTGTLTITKVAATTNADQTYAYSEVIDIDGHKSTTTSIEATYGNLIISDSGLSGTIPDDEAAINAIVAAAK